MDNLQDWLGGFLKEFKLISYGAFGVAMESVGVSMGLTKYKVEVGGLECCKDHFELKKYGPKMRAGAVRVWSTLKARVNAFSNEG